MRRSSEQVTKDLALDISDLLLEARVSPHTLALLLGTKDSTITHWLVYNRRPPQSVTREARNILKKIIAISQEPDFNEPMRNDIGQLRRVLKEWDESNAK